MEKIKPKMNGFLSLIASIAYEIKKPLLWLNTIAVFI